MSVALSPAMDQAVAAFRSPDRFLRLRARALPDDVLLLIRLAAGEDKARAFAVGATGESSALVVEAAVMFIQQVMFFPGSDSYRVLGVAQGADDSLIKEHYRWLVRWLHPDRNSDDWDAVYADRVNRAWQDLRTVERRRGYDSSAAVGAAPMTPAQDRILKPVGNVLPARMASDERLLSSQMTRRLPAVALVGLLLSAFVLLSMQYYLTRPEVVETSMQEPLPVVEAAADPTPETVPAATAPVVEPPILASASTPSATRAPLQQPESQPVAAAKRTEQVGAIRAAPKPVGDVATPVARSEAVIEPKPSLSADSPNARRNSPIVATAGRTAQAGAFRLREPAALLASARVQPAAVPIVPTAPALIDDAIASGVILRFRSAYASGNLNQLGSLLASNAGQTSNDRQAILKSYGELFKKSASRHIEIHNPTWLTDGDTAILIASYEAWILPRGQATARRVTGDIRFDLQSEDGQLRIVRLRHDSNGG